MSIPVKSGAFRAPTRHLAGWHYYRLAQRDTHTGRVDTRASFFAPDDAAARAYVPRVTYGYARALYLERAAQANPRSFSDARARLKAAQEGYDLLRRRLRGNLTMSWAEYKRSVSGMSPAAILAEARENPMRKNAFEPLDPSRFPSLTKTNPPSEKRLPKGTRVAIDRLGRGTIVRVEQVWPSGAWTYGIRWDGSASRYYPEDHAWSRGDFDVLPKGSGRFNPYPGKNPASKLEVDFLRRLPALVLVGLPGARKVQFGHAVRKAYADSFEHELPRLRIVVSGVGSHTPMQVASAIHRKTLERR